MTLLRPGLALCIALAASTLAKAQETDFYRGKTISMVIGHEPGAGFDIYARALIRHMPRHIPGTPTMVPQNMLGAVGLVATNWLYNVAPKDGTAMATFAPSNLADPLLGEGKGKFDVTKFTWIGNMDESVALCLTTRESGIKTFEDMRRKETLVGASGAGVAGPLSQTARAVKNLLGGNIKLIQGYKGSPSIRLAMLKNEVQGICGIPLSTVQSEWQGDVASGEFIPVLQMGVERHPDLKGVAHAFEFVRNDDERNLFDLVFGIQSLGRPFGAPPDIPAARAKILRDAFDATLKDSEFLAEAAKLRLTIKPMSGIEMEKRLRAVYALPSSLIEKARQAIRTD
jgi:tripartite-type tricarboxylate transporter receptor subunit TctC